MAIPPSTEQATDAVTETPDPKAARGKPQGGTDRAGFDLGGAKEEPGGKGDDGAPAGSTIIPGGSKNPSPAGGDTGRTLSDAGVSQGAARHPGGPATGSPEGEVQTATAGGLRPPQTRAGDRSNPAGPDEDPV